MLQTANPGDCALDAHTEAGMRYRAEFPQIEVPLEDLTGKPVFFEALDEQIVTCSALTASNDLTITFGSQYIHAKSDFGPNRIGFHIKRFDGARISVDHDRLFELL